MLPILNISIYVCPRIYSKMLIHRFLYATQNLIKILREPINILRFIQTENRISTATRLSLFFEIYTYKNIIHISENRRRKKDRAGNLGPKKTIKNNLRTYQPDFGKKGTLRLKRNSLVLKKQMCVYIFIYICICRDSNPWR